MLSFLRPSGPARPSVAEVADRAARGEMMIVDVREASEIRASGMAQGAINVPLALIAMKADPKGPGHDQRFRPDLPVALLCASGGRSGAAAQALKRLGYLEVHNMGGLSDWISGGGAVIR